MPVQYCITCAYANVPDPPEPPEAIMALEDDINDNNDIAIQPMPEGRAIFNVHVIGLQLD